MAFPRFDTLRLARNLEVAGFTRQQAEGFAEALADGMADPPQLDAARFASRLEASGFATQQAEALAEALSASLTWEA